MEVVHERHVLLRNLLPGDIFHAGSANGASLICLVVAVGDDTIQARTVTTQITATFDRRTGSGLLGDEKVLCAIDSVAPVPPAIHGVLLGLDRKFRLEWDWERIKLDDAEKQALIYVSTHYPSNPLPADSATVQAAPRS